MKKENLNYRVYRPEGELKYALFIVHGMQEHQGRYESFANYLNTFGIGVVTYDLPGHGKNAEEKECLGWFGEKNGWKVLVDSAVAIALKTKEVFPGVPLLYFGHSMGTIIGRVFLQTYDSLVDGMILSGVPAYNPGASVGIALSDYIGRKQTKASRSKVLDQMATGTFNAGIKDARTPLDWLSYNEDNVDAYIEDPLCGVPFTVQGYHDLFQLVNRMHKVSLYRCNQKDMPIYLFAGQDDPCIGGERGFASSARVLRKAGYTHIDEKLYPHMRHETLNEKAHEAVFCDVKDWIIANFD